MAPKDDPTDPNVINLKILQVLDRIQQRMETHPSEGSNDPVLARLADSFDKMTEAQQAIADAQNRTMRQVHAPDNKSTPKISVFNPRGDKDFPRPELKCPVFLVNYPILGDQLTREELELMNLLEPGTYPIKRTDGTPVDITIAVEKSANDGRYEKLTLKHPTAFGKEGKQQLPSMVDMLRTMLSKHAPEIRAKAKAVLTMEEEETLILEGMLNNNTKPENGLVVSVGA